MGIPTHEAFPGWVCQNVLGIADEGHVDEAVSIGGKGDYGIDIFHVQDDGDATEQYVYIVQAKFSESLNYVASREEMESFAATLGHLRDCPDGANKTFKQKSAEFVKIEESRPHIRKRLIFAVAGKASDQVREMVGNNRWKERLGHGPGSNVRLEILNLDDMLSRMAVPDTPTLQIQFDGNVIERLDKTTGRKSVTGYIDASSLVKLAKKYKETLFLENPRQAIGNTAPTYKAILNTLGSENMRKKFWKLNNGITAICTTLSVAGDQAYSIDNFKIVNGRQTMYTLEDSAHPIDDVFLPITIHEAVDDSERNQISEATNTQNPIKPVDLVTNYPEMTELVLQCKKDFRDFYFERQTSGFRSAKRSTQQRVTDRRVMKKGPTARSYYAYAISPVDAAMPDRVLFSVTSDPSPYEMVFKDTNIRDLIIPHIFMQSLVELHRKWCGELTDNPTEKTSRNKGIISKYMVKHYILRFIYKSMMGIDQERRESIKEKMIEMFRGIKQGDEMPEEFLNIAESAYYMFMFSFDSIRQETWPQDTMKRIQAKGYKEDENDMPTPYDIMQVLKQRGDALLQPLLNSREHIIRQTGDSVQARLFEIDSETGGAA